LLDCIEGQLTNLLPDFDVDVKDFCVEPYKIFTIARLLFVRKNREIVLPKLRLGQSNLQPRDPSLFPWFPLHLYQDIPFLLIRGYKLFGQAQSPNMYLDWCAKECQLRKLHCYLVIIL
jgi:hypothetical protein